MQSTSTAKRITPFTSGRIAARARAEQWLRGVLRRVTAAAGPDVVRRMSLFTTIGARPEMDIWPDAPVESRACRLRTWTDSGDLTSDEAERLLAPDASTPWRSQV